MTGCLRKSYPVVHLSNGGVEHGFTHQYFIMLCSTVHELWCYEGREEGLLLGVHFLLVEWNVHLRQT